MGAALAAFNLADCGVPLHGQCSRAACCQQTAPTWAICFEQAPGQHACLSSCTPGANSTCKTPFADPRAQARATERWPDMSCMLGQGEALVESDAFRYKYSGSCKKYCETGVANVVQGLSWISVEVQHADKNTIKCCPESSNCVDHGILCQCSFPDRRLSYV